MKIENDLFVYTKKDMKELNKRYSKRQQDRRDEGFIPRHSYLYHTEDCQNLHHDICEFIYKLQYEYNIDPRSLNDDDFILMYEMEHGALDKYELQDFKALKTHFNLIEKNILKEDEIERIKEYIKEKNE